MSEGSKMGLFGSKDKNKELKKEPPNKDDSPDRYAPYCIDSDSETYDTEALSMMDINDIIGVHSEPVSESTLESEIAALSQIITDSKGESSQGMPDKLSDSEEKESPNIDADSNDATVQLIHNQPSTQQPSAIETKEEPQTIEVAQDLKTICNNVHNSQSNVSQSDRNDSSESVVKSTNSKEHEHLEDKVVACTLSSETVMEVEHLPAENTHVNKDLQALSNDTASVTSETINSRENRSRMCDQNSENEKKSSTSNLGNINDSLQLIGEAYTSEDSQEPTASDEDIKEKCSSHKEIAESIPQSEEAEIGEQISDDINTLKQNVKSDEENECISTSEKVLTNTETSQFVDIIKTDTVINTPESVSHPELSLHTNNDVPQNADSLKENTVTDEAEYTLQPEHIETKKEDSEDTTMLTGNVGNEATVEQTGTSKDVTEIVNTSVIIEENNSTVTESNTLNVSKEDAIPLTMQTEVPVQCTENKNMENIEVPPEAETALAVMNESKVEESGNVYSESSGLMLESEQKSSSKVNIDVDVDSKENTKEEAESNKFEEISTEDHDERDNVSCSRKVESLPMDTDNENSVATKVHESMESLPMETSETHIEISERNLQAISDISEKNSDLLSNVQDVQTDVINTSSSDTTTSVDINRDINAVSDFSDSKIKAEGENELLVTDNVKIQEESVSDTVRSKEEEKLEETEIAEIQKLTDDIVQENLLDKSAITHANTHVEEGSEGTNVAENSSIPILPEKNLESDECQHKDKVAIQTESGDEKIVPGNIIDKSDEILEEEKVPTKVSHPISEVQTTSDILYDTVTPIDTSDKIKDTPMDIQLSGTNNVQLNSTLIITESNTTQSESTPVIEKNDNSDNGILVTHAVQNESPEKSESTDTMEQEIPKFDIPSETMEVTDKEDNDIKDACDVKSADIDRITDSKSANKNVLEHDQPPVKYDSTEKLQEETEETSTKKAEDECITDTLSNMERSLEETVEQNTCVKLAESEHTYLKENAELLTVVNNDKTDMQGLETEEENKTSFTEKTIVESEEDRNENTEEEVDITLNYSDSEMQTQCIPVEAKQEVGTINISVTAREEDDKSEEDKNEVSTIRENIKVSTPSEELKSEDVTKQDMEELKTEVDDNNLQSILESANNVVEMFSEEQCQNTQDIMTSILDNVRDVTDFKNILDTGGDVENDIEQVLQQSAELPLVEGEIEELAKKLPENSEGILNKDIGDSMSAQNIDSLEGLLDLNLIPEGEDGGMKARKEEDATVAEQVEDIEKDVDMTLLLQTSSHTSQDTDYITDVISSCLTTAENTATEESTQEADIKETNHTVIQKTEETLNIDENAMDESLKKEVDTEEGLDPQSTEGMLPENDLDMDFDENPLESVADLEEEEESKLELPQDILLESADQGETLNDTPLGIENSQASSEISELESAVKFLQESEEQAIDSPLVLSPKLVERVVDDISKHSDGNIFAPDEDICDDTSELVAEFPNIEPDSISISEAEIISEAAKLENERKLAEQVKLSASMSVFEKTNVELKENEEVELSASLGATSSNILEDKLDDKETLNELGGTINILKEEPAINLPKITERALKSESLPKVSILEERLKEPPKIEIPITEIAKVCESPTTPKDNLLIQKDAKVTAYQRMLESPKLIEKTEAKITDTPRKESEKHDFENVGSPRIILKIAKSAIADCGEPRSPKSPKIRSATNSPNPEDSPGQKLGKIKLKLSKGGHPSIISNENVEESVQWHTEGSTSLSPIGMKIKLSKSREATASEKQESADDIKETKHKFEEPKRTDSPIGMKIKLAKTKGGASIIPMENEESKERLDIPEVPKRTESPLGMKIKLSKSGDASIIHSETLEESRDVKHKEKPDVLHDMMKPVEAQCGMKIKMSKSGEASIIPNESIEQFEGLASEANQQRIEQPIGMKIKLSKSGDASIVPPDKQEKEEEQRIKEVHQEVPKRTESPLGMKIKLFKTGDASIIQNETSDDAINKSMRKSETDHSKVTDSPLKMKLLKSVDAAESEKKEKAQKRREADSSLEMKIKLSKTGHPTIVACDSQPEVTQKSKESVEPLQNTAGKYKEALLPKETPLKILKTGHAGIVQSNRAELTIEPVQMQCKKPEAMEISPKRKEITISPIEPKKSKLEAQLSQILPEVTIQPVMSRDQKQLLFDPKTSLISRQQMNVISQEISITQVRSPKPTDKSVNERLKELVSKNATNSPASSDCEIIEHRPELIIVNENSNSSQDVVIIEEVPSNVKMPDVKMPKKRGRPRRNPVPPDFIQPMISLRDPLTLAFDEMPQAAPPHFPEQRENERPKRTCRNQKSYAPPRRGRGRGRGKRKAENFDLLAGKKPRLEQDLSAIEASTMAVITLDDASSQEDTLRKSSELYKALKQPPVDRKNVHAGCKADKQPVSLVHKQAMQKPDTSRKSVLPDTAVSMHLQSVRMPPDARDEQLKIAKPLGSLDSTHIDKDGKPIDIQQASEKLSDEKLSDKVVEGNKLVVADGKDVISPPGHPNWLTPVSKRQLDTSARNEHMSSIQVIDEETRMSAESGSRSQTPARNLSAPATETIVNEESQGSVLSTATTESEKVKVKNRRMEINFDPDEGPFTVDKIAEYEWPLDRKGETFMIQEQISQYLGVKSFKRKYPDLKRRVVDMEERNYLRENGLVSEAMCDMGLTAICSSEVLDVMCSDFPDQYEEYRKHMREKQVKEHSKKQKELTAAANAERNRIDLAEMAVQSALSWNISLNKARRENRKCSLDLQTFTIHVPKKEQKVETDRKVSHYPVALIPGQYTDYYREYTPAELRYYPLNTVLYGPMRPNERKFDSQSEGSQSDSDTDSSSDDSSSSSSEGTQDTEGSQSTMDDVDMEIVAQKDEVKLKCKMCLKTLNKHSKNEILIQCGTCAGNVHPSCIDLTLDMVPHIQSYAWQCTDCKTCAQCHDPADEDKMLFCDMCDRGYHIYCVGLRRVPLGRWHCQECAVCANCGSREAGGANSDRNSVAQWQHEYRKADKNTRVYVSTLCVPCSKMRGDQGNGIRQEKLHV